MASQQLYPGEEKIFSPWSHIVKHKRIRLLGHIIREGPDSPTFFATFEDATLSSRQPYIRRVGRPRPAWTDTTMEDSWYKMSDLFYEGNAEQRETIKNTAEARLPPFDP